MNYFQYTRDIGHAIHLALRTPDGDPDDRALIIQAIHARIATSDFWRTLEGARETLGPAPWPPCDLSTMLAAHAQLTADIASIVYALIGE